MDTQSPFLDAIRPKPGAQSNQSIIDGIKVLKALTMADGPVGSRELSRQLNMETTRVNRLLKTLAFVGVAQQTNSKKYIPGPGIHVLASQSLHHSTLLANSVGPLERLSFYGHTVTLGVLWQDQVSFLYHRRPGMLSSDSVGRVGIRPATTSGIGMVLLAARDDEEVITTYKDQQNIPGFPHGVDSLIRGLNDIRSMGYAYTEVDEIGGCAGDRQAHSLAVPVGRPICGAISVCGWLPEQSVSDMLLTLESTSSEITDFLA